ncbi:MAG: hypothetical protein FKY71_14160 [Spiribacter salinus]|uniref:DUF4124 domain-containing protein n=1 Tax=Spiribacter salinus TaxID=1335746 RepID=A0A540VNT4_9GAMM|nr:MAG: hypothetical protein FKY71_14160 [Spiribacter salinus]
MRNVLAFVAVAALLVPASGNAARCKVDGEWYDYDSPECQGETGGSSNDDSSTDRTTSEPSGPTLNPGYVACLTEEHLDQYTRASVNDDQRLLDDLMGRVCLRTASHMEISLLEQGWTRAKVRVYTDERTLDLWTPIEALPGDI